MASGNSPSVHDPIAGPHPPSTARHVACSYHRPLPGRRAWGASLLPAPADRAPPPDARLRSKTWNALATPSSRPGGAARGRYWLPAYALTYRKDVLALRDRANHLFTPVRATLELARRIGHHAGARKSLNYLAVAEGTLLRRAGGVSDRHSHLASSSTSTACS